MRCQNIQIFKVPKISFILETFWLNFSEYIDDDNDAENVPSWWASYEDCPLMNMESNLAKVC